MQFHDFTVKKADGSSLSLADYKGKVVLVVNVASQCGFTYQYEGLQKLYEQFHDRGLEILGFPCNQFAGQEPGDDSEIQNFCSTRFNVKFPILAKIEVNGTETEPLYDYLKTQAPGLLGTRAIKWNFTKFLVSKDGRVLKRFAPKTKPEELVSQIESALK